MFTTVIQLYGYELSKCIETAHIYKQTKNSVHYSNRTIYKNTTYFLHTIYILFTTTCDGTDIHIYKIFTNLAYVQTLLFTKYSSSIFTSELPPGPPSLKQVGPIACRTPTLANERSRTQPSA